MRRTGNLNLREQFYRTEAAYHGLAQLASGSRILVTSCTAQVMFGVHCCCDASARISGDSGSAFS